MDRRRWEREDHQRREAEYKAGTLSKYSSTRNSSTFFFSNFPVSYGEQDMFRIFQKWARVKEVFISKRPNRWGRTFGFVRLFPVPNEVRLEKQLDQIYIGNLKLYVNLPKYRRA